jgi:hypothetical protein
LCPLRQFPEGVETTGDVLGGRTLEIVGTFDLNSSFEQSGLNVIKRFTAVLNEGS